ncbi:serine/threonine-protein kinase [Actinomadura rubrisoli]|uniref:serine/threonine-protein kinase n=1 Tax=Actinomadura rubrisoli TaxID=2530368 RepID=UPI0014049753|nr:serine/threonine-protein kinase [Actinomadura rubrisoli]
MPAKAGPLRPGDPARIGSYEVIGFLGEGGMGSVFLARSPGGLVAVKVVRADYARHAQFRERFRREAHSALRVPRFCTAEVLAADPDADPPYLVTEFIDGPTLDEVVAAGGPLRRAELEQLGVSMAVALAGVHGVGVVHRDLKPANVLLSRTGPRVIDFGIASAVDAAFGLTGTGQIVGTPGFMAPEQFESGETRQPADIFAWGAVMAFAATGRRPFGAGPVQAIAYRIVHGEPDMEGLDDGPLRTVISAALNKDPARRPSARELLARLGVADGDPADGAARRLGRAPAGPSLGHPPGTHQSTPPGLPPPTSALGPGGGRIAREAPTPPTDTGRLRRRGLLWGGVAAALALVFGLVAVPLLRSGGHGTPESRPPRTTGGGNKELEGRWTSTYGAMYVRVDGDEIRMLYEWGGLSRVRGTVTGDVINAVYSEGPSSEPTGRVRFRILRSAKTLSFEGKWALGFSGDLTSDWNADRVGNDIPPTIGRKLDEKPIFPRLPS